MYVHFFRTAPAPLACCEAIKAGDAVVWPDMRPHARELAARVEEDSDTPCSFNSIGVREEWIFSLTPMALYEGELPGLLEQAAARWWQSGQELNLVKIC